MPFWAFETLIERLENLKVTNSGNLNYEVCLDHCEYFKSKSLVKLLQEGNTYKIDYSQTEFLD